MSSKENPGIFVIAGVNGAGKSSIAGRVMRKRAGEYYNPDEAARLLLSNDPLLSIAEANGLAWRRGVERLKQAIALRKEFVFETTLGGNTIPRILSDAAAAGIDVHIWYVGLSNVELHIQRVRARVQHGGHDIPEADIRRRFEKSRLNLIKLMSALASLHVLDNSFNADPAAGKAPKPVLLLTMKNRYIVHSRIPSRTPGWAKPIIVAGYKLAQSHKTRPL